MCWQWDCHRQNPYQDHPSSMSSNDSRLAWVYSGKTLDQTTNLASSQAHLLERKQQDKMLDIMVVIDLINSTPSEKVNFVWPRIQAFK